MRLKLYRAGSMAEAMAQMRAELGGDALILATRRVVDGMELTAAVEGPTHEPAPIPPPSRREALDFHGVPTVLHEPLLAGELATAIGRTARFATLDLSPGAKPLLLAGPPGAGKTLSVARLATRLVMGGATPMVITADGRRAGATEQLAAFTRLLGINLVVASHPSTLDRALRHRPLGAPVLIDAPGTDPFDPVQRDEIFSLAATAEAEVALVLPAGLQPDEASDIARIHEEAGASLLIVTRFDITRRLGAVLAAGSHGLALAEAGISPGAADGMVALTPDFLAARLGRTDPPIPERLQ